MPKKSYQELFTFLNAAELYLKLHPGENKLKHSIKRMYPQIEKIQLRYNQLVEDINIDWCSVDDRGNVLRIGDEYVFTKDNLKERNRRRQKLFESEVEFTPQFVAEVPPDLDEQFRAAFTGIILRPEDTEGASGQSQGSKA